MPSIELPSPTAHRSSSILRLAGLVTILFAALAAGGALLDGGNWDGAGGLLAAAGLIGLGIVFIGVSLIAHILESQDLARVGALLDQAEREHGVFVEHAERLAAELGLDAPAHGMGAGA